MRRFDGRPRLAKKTGAKRRTPRADRGVRQSDSKRIRRIAVITGTRAEFGLLRSSLMALSRKTSIEFGLIVCGMHLLPRFGRTVREIESEGWPIVARVAMQRGDDSTLDQAQGLSRGVVGIARALRRAKSDVVLVLGDRIEALAGALAGLTIGRAVAHIHGGDIAPGDIDDRVRDAISQIADIHFPASKRSAARLIAMGAPPNRVYCVGAPGLDEIAAFLSLRRNASCPDSRTALIVQHPCGRAATAEQAAMSMILDEVAEAGLRRVIIHPNSDRGCSGVVRAIRNHLASSAPAEAILHRSLPRLQYLQALQEASLLVGNSSSGIIEAPLIGTPSVDVGDRQRGREIGGATVIHARESAAAVRRAIREALRKPKTPDRRGPYGDGRAGERIATLLAQWATQRGALASDRRGVVGA